MWVARDKSAFEWFSDLLAALENDNLGDFLDIRVYLTAKFGVEEAKEIMYAEENGGADQVCPRRRNA